MKTGHSFNYTELFQNLFSFYHCLKVAHALASHAQVLHLRLLAAITTNVLNDVGHDFSLNFIRQLTFDVAILVVHVALGTEPDRSGNDS